MATIITEAGVEKAVFTEITEDKLDKATVKKKLDNAQEAKVLAQAKHTSLMNSLNAEIDELRMVLAQFKA